MVMNEVIWKVISGTPVTFLVSKKAKEGLGYQGNIGEQI